MALEDLLTDAAKALEWATRMVDVAKQVVSE